jgi:RNA polymerase sigma-70 factor, ECF subfamily
VDTEQQKQLTAAAKEGDPEAWERLYRNIYPRLYVYAIGKVGTGPAEDMVNETMARAVRSIQKFKWAGGGFDAWLFGILRRVCLEHHRRNRPADMSRFAEMLVSHTHPGEAIEKEEELDALRIAFARLDEADQEILTLRLVSGLSAEEVAKLVGKTPGAVRTAQSRALASLRLLVGQTQ